MVDPDWTLVQRLQQRAKLAGGGGGSDDGGMLEQRVAALEADMREVKSILGRMEPLLRGIDDRLRKIEIDSAELKGRVSQLPTAWTYVTTSFGMLLAIVGSVFAMLKLFMPA